MNETESGPAPEPYARISAQTRRQAMDWSLVLASQDIHPIIAPPGESRAWALLVEPGQYERAITAIQQYRLENRGWAWRRNCRARHSKSTRARCSGACSWLLPHWVVTFVWPELEIAGRMDNVRVHAGEWWRLGTALMLHADLAHLISNATFGVVFLGFAMARFGPGITLLTTYVAGIFGNIVGLSFYAHPYVGVGASGMMMVRLGCSAFTLWDWRQNPKAARFVLSGVFAGFLLFVMFGVSPRSDILAHFGGFVADLACFLRRPFLSRTRLESRSAILSPLRDVMSGYH